MDRFIATMPSALDDRCYVMAEAGLGGKVLETFLADVVHEGHQPDDLFAGLDDAVRSVEPGAGGVMFLPWLEGAAAPRLDGRLKGGFLGMGLGTSRAQLLRAVLEGVSMQMRWLVDDVEVVLGTRHESVRFTGGGATSDAWAQVMADVLGRRVEQLADPRHANARGAALLGFLSIRALTIADLHRLVPIRPCTSPTPAPPRSSTTDSRSTETCTASSRSPSTASPARVSQADPPEPPEPPEDPMAAKRSHFPYADRYTVLRGLPSEGRDPAAVLAELREMAEEEDRAWESGKASGSFYCGDHEHYRFMTEAFGLYGHVNALQRDIAPSATRFEGEIIAMALDLMHAGAAVGRGHEPVGLVTSGGTGSIAHAMLAYREQAYAAGNRMPNVVKAETAHPAFDKACHLFGIELRRAPIDPATTLVDVDAMAALIDDHTVALVASAGNYGYGTVDPIGRLSDLAVARGVGLHVDGCLGGFILPFAEELGYGVPPFDFRLPGVTTISADTHKYGYGLKGTSVLMFRDKALRNGQYFVMTDWSGGRYMSPGMDGSRSSGLLAATWASMVVHGRAGYREKARRILETSFAMQEAVRSHPSLRLMGEPTFCFSFSSDDYDVYHVNDFMRTRGWRLNGQQHPNALHMAVTGPQTQPGVVEAWTVDLADAVAHALEHRGERARSSSVYAAGSVEAAEADQAMRAMMAAILDRHQAVPPPE